MCSVKKVTNSHFSETLESLIISERRFLNLLAEVTSDDPVISQDIIRKAGFCVVSPQTRNYTCRDCGRCFVEAFLQ